MKIYAIRDRLIDYFQLPFAADNDKAVQATLSSHINNQEAKDAIAQAPHHFELWQLGIVQEDGHLTAEQTLICDCSSLVRRDIRGREAGNEGAAPLRGPEGGSGEPPGHPPLRTRTDQRAPPEPTQAKNSPRAEIAPGSGRLD